MTAHILRIDLSQNAADFESLALEPGLPMLDRTGANYNVLRRWLGELAAEPAWTDGAVHYYLRDEKHGRLTDAICLPATHDDLNGSLKASVEQLLTRLHRVRPAREVQIRSREPTFQERFPTSPTVRAWSHRIRLRGRTWLRCQSAAFSNKRRLAPTSRLSANSVVREDS